MLRSGTQDSYIRNRVNMPTARSHAELTQMDPKIRAQSFFSARVAEAHILDRLREVSDRYSRGEIGLGEARNTLKDFLKAEGYDPHKAGLKNLASTARLNLVMRQNAAMANAAAEWKRMHDPDAMTVFPYVRYHARIDSRSRDSHKKLDGKIFRKDDPFLKTHTPPWEFNCRCWLEEITAKEAGRESEKVQEPTLPEDVTIDSDSGFSFDPEHAFEEFDCSIIQDKNLRENTEKTLTEVYSAKVASKKSATQQKIVRIDYPDAHVPESVTTLVATPPPGFESKKTENATVCVATFQQGKKTELRHASTEHTPRGIKINVTKEDCEKINALQEKVRSGRVDKVSDAQVDAYRRLLHERMHSVTPEIDAPDENIGEIANEELTRKLFAEAAKKDFGLDSIPQRWLNCIEDYGGYQNDVAALRQFAADIGGDELLAEYKSFVADLALQEHRKVEKIDKFFEPHLKNAGFSGNFTIRDVFDRKSKVSKWMKTRKK